MKPRMIALALAALLLPLLAACGGSAPTASAPTAALAPTSVPISNSTTSADTTTQKITGPTAVPPVAPAAGVAAPLPAATSAATEPSTLAVESGAGGAAPLPAVPPRQGQQQLPPLKAGEVDDNLDFAAYRIYLNNFMSGGVHKIDVIEHYIITIVNDQQQPVLDATVRIFDGDRPVFEGRTYAGGRTIFFPGAISTPPNSNTLRVEVQKGQANASGQLIRGQEERQTIVIAGAEALPATTRLDVLFLLDATGSMGDEIGSIQQTIDSIAARIAQFEPRPTLRFGLVSYRDRGDAYVTNLDSNFTSDVSAFRQALLQVHADGGGDTPEDINSGLQVAIQQMGWSEDAVRLVFLVADAPAHLDYGQEFDYTSATREAVRKGIKIYPIGASNTDDQAEYQFRQMAQQTLASFIFLTYQPGQSGGAPGDSTTMNVDPEQFTVDRLDDLVVRVVQRELRAAIGAS
jgi:hypothetical protein